MWPDMAVIMVPLIHLPFRFFQTAEPMLVQHSFLSLPFKLSTKVFCVALPGWIKVNFTLFSLLQKSIALLVYLVPLSQTMDFWGSLICFSSYKKRATHAPEIFTDSN